MKKELEEEFKSFSDDILNSLTNAEVTAEAVAKNISESMRKELIESMYIEQYEPRIKSYLGEMEGILGGWTCNR